MTKKQIIIKDVLLSYLSNEVTNSKYTLLFLHGWRSEAKIWNEVISSLNYSSLALDLPGFGESQSPSNAYTLNDFSETVLEFINKLNLQNVVLIGHSNGGAISIKFLSKNPNIISKLVLVDSSGIRKQTSEKSLEGFIAKLVKPFFQPEFMQPLRKKIYESMGSDDYLAEPRLKETYLNMISEDLTPLLNTIEVPTLLIWGDKDQATPLADAQLMNSNIKNSELKIIPNTEHFSFLQNKELFLQYLNDFLSK